MTPLLIAALKFLIPLTGSILILKRYGKGSLLAGSFELPSLRQAALWWTVYVSWMLATNAIIGWRGPWDLGPWRDAPIAASLLRVLAVVVVGPILEELVFRGLAFTALARSRAGAVGAVIITAVCWSLLHWSYDAQVISVIAVAGAVLGIARWRSGSVLLPIAMHMTWNAFAIW
jgi:membrane protease YdiL (CAAX protease family)